MTIEEVKAYCGGRWSNIGKLLGFSPNTYQGWIKAGEIPLSTQYKIERMTHGALVARIESQEEQNNQDIQ